jgi:hypothetical protein
MANALWPPDKFTIKTVLRQFFAPAKNCIPGIRGGQGMLVAEMPLFRGVLD